MRSGRWHGSIALTLAAVWLSGSTVAPVQAAALDNAIQQHIRAATFEVVQLKPADGAVEYDRPLPLDLIPYQQRTDKYRSIGTAFAIAPHRFATAAHVLAAGSDSQFGPPALRDAAGNVYAIDKVLKYAAREDFVVFSLRDEPKGVQVLEAGGPAAINDTVFAVGNALGEGIVIRDGVYTSETPEEMNGEWKWLRFSAAASPGNSGGPLLNQGGQLLGIVLRKSESENLNYALPIARLNALPDGEGRIESRSSMRLPVIDASEPIERHEHFALPLSLADFYKTVATIALNGFVEGEHRIAAHYTDRLFPHGSGSAQLLHRVFNSPFPRFMHEKQDGIWELAGANPSGYQLDKNGYVRIANGFVRLRAPDDVPLTMLYGDSKLLMDMLLKGFPLRRQVGSESVRVTSLGKGTAQGSYTDSYGRTWQILSWNIPYDDQVLTALCLPTPEGYAMILVPALSGVKGLLLKSVEFLTDYVYVTLSGTLSEWQDYLKHKDLQPKAFDSIAIDIDPARHVRYASKRLALEVKPELVKLSADSVLNLDFSFYHEGDKVVWDIGELSLFESPQKHNGVTIVRIAEPDSSLPEGFQSTWKKIGSGDFPYNGSVYADDSNSAIKTVATPAHGHPVTAKVNYIVTVLQEGQQPQGPMSRRLKLLERSFKSLEQ